jgi:hypothetical protein
MTPQSLAAALLIGAGLVHAAAAGTHTGDDALVRLFAATALVQVGLGVGLLLRPSRRLLLAASTASLLAAGAWLLSRTTGLPVLDSLREREEVGLQDGAGALLALAAAGVCFLAAGRRSMAAVLGRPALALVAVVPVALGLVAPHQHAASHDHDHGLEAVATAAAGADPIFAGADTSRAAAGQLAAARDLVRTTRAAVGSRFTDESSVVAAGYQSIGDGRRIGQTFEHFVNPEYLADGHVLDPDRIESIVFEVTTSGKKLASAMYILEPGTTLADAPDVAGELTTWHDHQNLCWDPSGTRLTGAYINGRCIPSGTFRPTPPMLHVWLGPNPCGPFAGIEGSHGTACAAHVH